MSSNQARKMPQIPRRGGVGSPCEKHTVEALFMKHAMKVSHSWGEGHPHTSDSVLAAARGVRPLAVAAPPRPEVL